MLKRVVFLIFLVNYVHEALTFPKIQTSEVDNETISSENDIENTDTERVRIFQNEDTTAPSWSYEDDSSDGPEMWGNFYPACNGTLQSPINLKLSKFIKKSYRKKLDFDCYNHKPKSIEIINNGHTAQLQFEFNENEIPVINGGPLKGDYQFEQFHFHWGSTNRIGSEHYLDSRQYAMEIHLVHFNAKYGSFENAMDKPDGLTVLGFFYKVRQVTPYITFVKYLDDIREAHTSRILSSKRHRLLTLSTLIGNQMDDYITYEGSLTTPPCYESVQWIVSAKVHYVTPQEINEFRKLYDVHGEYLVNNYRPLQKRNDRIIYYSAN